MLRTNLSFLTFIRDLHDKQSYPEDIILKKFPAGDFILKQGARSTKVFIIKEGITKCFLSEENGKDYIVEFLSEGEIAGEIEVIKKANCLCSIEAITEVWAYSITIPLFNQLLEKDASFNKLILAELAERIVNTSIKASTQQLYTIEHGLKKILDLQAKQNIEVSKEDMAAYLGITIRSLNRALKELQ
jgi:CRP-like cAMP-binding protein